MPATPKNSQNYMTEAENRLWSCLCAADLGPVEFHPQHVIGGYTVDFCAPSQKLIIEVEDPQTVEHDEFYMIRNAWFKADGWRLLRFTNHDALKNTDAVLSVILAILRKSGPAALRSAAKSLEGVMDFEI